MKVYAQQNDNLDAIIYRYFGTSYGWLEETLRLNPTLTTDAIIEIGTEVILPDRSAEAVKVKSNSIHLWS